MKPYLESQKKPSNESIQSSSAIPLIPSGIAKTLFLAWGLWAFGCTGDVEVGDPGNSGGTQGDGDGDEVPSGGTGPTPTGGVSGGDGGSMPTGGALGLGGSAQCEEEDADRIESYSSYQSEPNVWGELLGNTYSGYVEGGVDGLLLTIGEDGSAHLKIGDPAPSPTEPKEGYLCDSMNPEFARYEGGIEGATYEIHGALVEQGRVRINLGSPYDPWCKIQEPKESGDPTGCYFRTIRNDTIEWGDVCKVGDEVVDCCWFGLAEFGPCECTSTECFGPPGDGFEVDARVNADGDIVGTLWGGTLYLFQEE